MLVILNYLACNVIELRLTEETLLNNVMNVNTVITKQHYLLHKTKKKTFFSLYKGKSKENSVTAHEIKIMRFQHLNTFCTIIKG